MKSLTFIDTEIDPSSKKILDIGGLKIDGSAFTFSTAFSDKVQQFVVITRAKQKKR